MELFQFLNFSVENSREAYSVDSVVIGNFRYWNYLRKQTFVLESYNTPVNRIMNRALFYSHCWLSWSFVIPFAMSTLQLLAFLRFIIGSPYLEKSLCTTGLSAVYWRSTSITYMYTHHTYTFAFMYTYTRTHTSTSTSTCISTFTFTYSNPLPPHSHTYIYKGSYEVVSMIHTHIYTYTAPEFLRKWLHKVVSNLCVGFMFACGHLLCAMIEMVSLWNISRVEINLCNALSPEQERLSTQMYNWFIVSRDFSGIEKLKHVQVHLLWTLTCI